MASVNLILAGLALPPLAAAAYLLMLTVVWRRPSAPSSPDRTPRLVVLVPAHNEEAGIGSTITSLQEVDYPGAARRIVVIADNCTDATAQVAAAHGAEVIVRHDDQRRGKGWALQYAIDQLLTDSEASWEGLVVVDADTVVSPNLLQSVAGHLADGALAVQAAYLPRATGHSAMAVITDVAFAAFHLVRSGARERLQLSCGLRGNGMAFSRGVLKAVPHTAFSRTEDLEFGVLLGLHGVRVAFAGDTRVYGDMPERTEVVAQQRERWIGGRVALARRFAWPLLVAAMRRRSAMLLDLAVDLAVPPLSALLVVTLAGVAAAGILSVVTGTVGSALVLWSVAFVALTFHVAHAARVAGRGWAFVHALRAVPAYALGKTSIAWRGLRPSKDIWIRTTRQGEAQ